MIKKYECPNCKKKTHADGIIPECDCTNPKTDMVEIK